MTLKLVPPTAAVFTFTLATCLAICATPRSRSSYALNLQGSAARDAQTQSQDSNVQSLLNQAQEHLRALVEILPARALCHGGIDRQPSTLQQSFYPAPPNLILHPPDDPEWHLFFIINNGVRYTGMPAWDKTLSESDMWKVTAFLARIEKLPPAVQEFWKKTSGSNPPVASEEGHSDHK